MGAGAGGQCAVLPAFGLRAFGWTEVSILATNLLSGLTLVLNTLAIASFQRHRAQPVRSALVWLPPAIIMVVVLFFRKGIMGDKELPDLLKKRQKKLQQRKQQPKLLQRRPQQRKQPQQKQQQRKPLPEKQQHVKPQQRKQLQQKQQEL